jgi:hypothetical protein
MNAMVAKAEEICFETFESEAYDFVMKRRTRQELEQMVRDYLDRLLRRKGEPQEPEDPYSYVTAPKKPKPSSRSAAAVAEPPEH